MLGDDGKPLIEGKEGFFLAIGLGVVGLEEFLDEDADELRSGFLSGHCCDGTFKAIGVPGCADVAPAVACGVSGVVENGEEGPIAHLLTEVLGVVEESFGEVDTGDGGVGMDSADEFDVASEDAGFHVALGDHVVRHEEDFFALDPGVVFGDDFGEFWEGAGFGVALEDEVKDGHEVAFAAAEAAVEVGGFAGGAFDRAFDEGESIVKTGGEFGGDDVGV